MRNYLVLAVAVSLVACGGKTDPDQGAANAAEATAEAANAEEAAAPAAATAATPAAGAAPTKDYMVGKWAEAGDCGTMAIEFKADGSMVGPVDRWELNGAELTMVGLPQKMVLSVVDDKTMESRLDGKDPARKLTRC